MKKSNTVVLVHGNFVNELTWTEWKSRYEAKGYIVHTPTNPGHAGVPSKLRKNL